jgi:hypothetical protein
MYKFYEGLPFSPGLNSFFPIPKFSYHKCPKKIACQIEEWVYNRTRDKIQLLRALYLLAT